MEKRHMGLAYVLLIFGGVFGIHKFYLNQTLWGIIYFFTGGLFLIGVLIDLFTLPSQVNRCNCDLGWTSVSDALAVRNAQRSLQDLDRRLTNLEAAKRL